MAEKVPPGLKAVRPYLMIAKQFDKKDPVVAYYANMYAVQEGIGQCKNDPTAKKYLLGLMDQLQETKRLKKDEEALTNDVVAQAHIEEVALKLFDFADGEDRAGRFQRNMIKAFFTSSQIFTLLKQFGELAVGIDEKTKYAKWKAVEIDRCLKNGITPTPGPPAGDDDFGDAGGDGQQQPGWNVTPPNQGQLGDDDQGQPPLRLPPGAQQVFPVVQKPVPKPRQPAAPTSDEVSSYQPPAALSGVTLGPEQMTKAQKLCKFAMSSLDYDDVQGAIDNLTKALHLLKTGQELKD